MGYVRQRVVVVCLRFMSDSSSNVDQRQHTLGRPAELSEHALAKGPSTILKESAKRAL